MPRGIYPRKPRQATSHDRDSASPAAAVTVQTQASHIVHAVKADDGVALTTKTSRLVDDIRKPFRAYCHDFTLMATSRAELAPRFMKACRSWQDETKGSFIGFVRVLDPTVPERFEDYKRHPVYNAADYLARLVRDAERVQRPEVPEDERPVTPLVALARLVATVLPSVDPNGTIWNAFVREMHWSPQQAERVKVLGAKQGPIRLRGRQGSTLRAAAA